MSRRYVVTPCRRPLLEAVRGVLARPGSSSWGWFAAWTATYGGASVWQSMQHAGASVSRTAAVTFFIGLVGGVAWQWLNRRDLVDRFAILAMLGVAGCALSLLPSDAATIDVRVIAPSFGVLAGTVLLEWWLRLPSQRERYSEVEPRHQPQTERTSTLP